MGGCGSSASLKSVAPPPILIECDPAQHSGAIVGRVYRNSTASPEPAVHVRIQDGRSGCHAMTDILGYYGISGVPAGTHQIVASRIGLETRRARAEVSPGGTITLDLSMAPAIVYIAGCEPEPPISNAVRRREIQRRNPLFLSIPAPITKSWVLAVFPQCIECCPYEEQRSRVWNAVRTRADFIHASIGILEDPTLSHAHDNAVFRLGATNQDHAYDYLFALLERLPPGDDLRTSVILSLGSGLQPSERALARLRDLLCLGALRDQHSAEMSLRNSRSAAAQALVEQWRLGQLCGPAPA